MQPKIDEENEWKRDIAPLLAELVAHTRESALSMAVVQSELQLLRSKPTGVADLRQATSPLTLGPANEAP